MKLLFIALFALTSFSAAQNAVIFNNVTTYGGHSDAGILVGGDWLGTNYEANQHNKGNPAIYLVGDNLTSNFLRANHGISDIEGSKGNFQNSLADLARPDFQYYASLSSQFDSLSGTTVNLNAQNNVRLSLTQPITVYDITASQLSGYKTLDFSGQGGVVVFNVTGNLPEWSWSVNYDPNKIVWNFLDATSVNINNRQFTGSLIAPNALVNQSQNINGTLIAKDWTVYNSAELHSYNLPSVPEASSVLLVALAGLAILTHRKR